MVSRKQVETMTTPADREGERPQTVGEAAVHVAESVRAKSRAIRFKLRSRIAMYVSDRNSQNDLLDSILRLLNLDPDTVVDGPLVVLHPGEVKARRRENFWNDQTGYLVIVASNPEVEG